MDVIVKFLHVVIAVICEDICKSDARFAQVSLEFCYVDTAIFAISRFDNGVLGTTHFTHDHGLTADFKHIVVTHFEQNIVPQQVCRTDTPKSNQTKAQERLTHNSTKNAPRNKSFHNTTGATEMRRKCDGDAAELRRRGGGATEVRRKCDGDAAERRRCDGGATEVRRRCDGDAAERRRCDGSATEV